MAVGLRKRNNASKEGNNYLFLIGIDKYNAPMYPLYNCVKDVKSLAEVLTTRYEFKYENLILLTDEQATRENIYTSFLDLISKLTAEDSIVIYYAGMGTYNELVKEAYLIPVDGDYTQLDKCIELSTIEKWLNSFKTKHVTFISDSDQSFNLINHGYRIS